MKYIWIILITCSLYGQDRDFRWVSGNWSFAPDKQKHVAVCSGINFTLALTTKMPWWGRVYFSVATAGIKEIRDGYRTSATTSDLVYSIGGSLLAEGLIFGFKKLIRKKP